MSEEFRKFLIDELCKIKEYTLSDGVGVYNTYTYALKKYDELHEPVAIPKFMSDWIEENRERYKNTFFSIGYDLYSNTIRPPVDDWIIGNQEKFVRAWFDAYKIEKEPLYYALIKGHELVNDEGEWSTKYWNLWVSGGCVFPADRLADYDDFLTTMSKEEWSEWGINDTNADFVKVEENE